MRHWFPLIVFGLATVPSPGEEPVPAPAPPSAAAPMIVHPAGAIRDDGTIQDSLGTISIRPMPDPVEELPPFLQRVEYLREHHDNLLVISYLRQIVTNGDIAAPFRARAILELADCLGAEHQEAESLCWLKIWMELYPARPEVGAVAYRIGEIYTRMGLPELARDAFYLALAHTINDGQVHNADDLRRYTELTVGTLWRLATNEYQSGQWERAAELFARYRKECPTATKLSLEKAAFLQADCCYQLKQTGPATTLYEQTLRQHPFNPLAPEARLRLYHLYVIQNAPEKARDELESLAWTVRTVWPQDETYWQKETARMLFDLNKKNADVLPPLVQVSAALPPEGKSWQETLNHYDALVHDNATMPEANMDRPGDGSNPYAAQRGLPERADLLQMDKDLNLLFATQTASTQ